MTAQLNVLKDGYQEAVLWQTDETEKDAPQPAIQIRTYEEGIVEIRQVLDTVYLNTGSVNELVLILKQFADKPQLTPDDKDPPRSLYTGE
jgi:hypothetical protein